MFSRAAIEAAKRHALDEYPRESVGAIVAGEYRPIVNQSKNDDQVEFDERDALCHGSDLWGLIHSHPATPDHPDPNIPSADDQRTQLSWDIPFGIIVCNERVAREPFFWGPRVPRPHWQKQVGFHWVVQDCYQKIRDVYAQARGIELINFVREWGEWKGIDGKPPRSGYVENFPEAGFIEVDRPQTWDLVLVKFTDVAVISHAGVLLDGNQWIHHLANEEDAYDPTRLSITEPIARWWSRHMDPRNGGKWLRYVGRPQRKVYA